MPPVVRPILLSLLSATLIAAEPADPISGFTAESARVQRDWEAKFQALPRPDSLRAYMRRLSAHPHHVGSPYDRDNADWLRERLASWGWDAKLERFDVLFPTPKTRIVELVAPTSFRAKLEEPPVPGDATTAQRAEQLPSYNAYSADGDVTAPLVYVNYGIPADYERLERLGVSVKGAIVIARYGGSWRGIKPKVAAEHGAVGCLIYSDPKDDGYWVRDVFPAGPARPKDGVQRGSVADMPLYPGDPMTPGIGSVPGARRLPFDSVRTLTKIPVLPISYADAQPLLGALGGPLAPADWRGALPLTYHVGAGPARVHLAVKSNWDTKAIYDVIARIPGAEAPDEWVVRGNHYDAWVNGAIDPISGQVSLLEEARALGELVKQGWKPRRTIIYAAWDGEEPGLIGSTEWVETHAADLDRHAVAYLNSDVTIRGFLGVAGSHSLEAFINAVAREIKDPETGFSVWKRAQLHAIGRGTPDERREARERSDLRIEALGSGSDYTPFLQHGGIASLNLQFQDDAVAPSGYAGVYHSIYDDFNWATRFGDTAFVYGRAFSQLMGTAVMRLADAQVLPYAFEGLADNVSKYATEVKKLLADRQDQANERNRELAESVFVALNDPRAPESPPPTAQLPPFLNFAPLDNGVAELERSAKHYDELLARLTASGGGSATTASALADVNAKLVRTERTLTLSDGLPGRPWFRHQIYAPGFYTGYGVKTLPGVREAIEENRWEDADRQLVRLGAVLEAEAKAIDAAAAALEPLVAGR
ncbi:MAG TPA: M28 family metallopeptidase [Gemmatimonadales bacterium]|nr:M28 family metallopeptidase [Gemmatimonadales bacterium]